MTKNLKLKEELKALSIEIKQLKLQFKESQRDVSRQEQIMDSIDYSYYSLDYSYYRSTHKFEEWQRLLRIAHDNMELLQRKSNEYRANHIFYSIRRGKSISQIEPKTKEYDPMRFFIYVSVLPKLLANEDVKDNLLPKSTLKSMGKMDYNGQYRLFTHDELRRIAR